MIPILECFVDSCDGIRLIMYIPKLILFIYDIYGVEYLVLLLYFAGKYWIA